MGGLSPVLPDLGKRFPAALDTWQERSYSGPTAPESAFPDHNVGDLESPAEERDDMFNRRVKLAATAAATCALVATGCGSAGSGGSSAATDSNPATVTGTLRVLVPSYPASNDGKAALNKVVATLHQKYPKVKVEPDFATFDTLNQKM